MKKTFLSLAIIGLLALVSCAPKEAHYELASKGELTWKGIAADNSHGHNGTVSVTEGTIDYTGEEFKGGKFSVDLKSMKSELTPDKGSTKLYEHLGSADFLNFMAVPNAEVTISKIEGGKAEAKITLAGKSMEASFPVKITKTEKELMINGKFVLDFTSLGIKGLTPSTEPGMEMKHVSPKVDFELNLTLAAKM